MSSVSSQSPVSRSQRGDEGVDGARLVALSVLGWLIPGATHLLLGYTRKGLIFFVVLTGMWAIGLGFDGQLFPFQTSEWLVFLACLAQWGLGLPCLVGEVTGLGTGDVTSITYEYGNTFLMTAGLLNALVVLNAYDLARGRTGR